MVKDKDTTIPVSTRLDSETILAIKTSGESPAEFLRKAVDERLNGQDINYIEEKIKEKEEELKILKKKKYEIEGIQKQRDNLSQEEIDFFLESDRILKSRPEFLDGRIDLYTNVFMKPFKLTRKEFLSKIVKVQTENCKQMLTSEK